MIRFCPWKKDIIKHTNSTMSSNEAGVYKSNCTDEDVSIDFGSCSIYACPFYDEAGNVWCRRVSLERGEE